MAKKQSRTKKYKRQTKKKSKKYQRRNKKTNHRNTQTRRRMNMRGGFAGCGADNITEPGFNVPAYGKAPGLNIPDTKVALGSADKIKIDHPMVNQ